jgi:predicted lactoylglutathione lyase
MISQNLKVFINLPVADLAKSVEFYKKIGFNINPQFTDEKAACFIISDTIYVMLLKENFFSTFSKKLVINALNSTEVINALSVDNREDVDMLVDKAIAAGGRQYYEPEIMEGMYSKNFEDPDGHQWEIFWMDPKLIV